jgi:uncharacterized paraquat-inducible protein A
VALLYDANGCEIRDGIAHADIVAAIQAAALADEFQTAEEIADRHGLKSVCLKCAIKNATTAHYDRDLIIRRVCITCYHALELRQPQSFSDMKMMLDGVIKRDVQ